MSYLQKCDSQIFSTTVSSLRRWDGVCARVRFVRYMRKRFGVMAQTQTPTPGGHHGFSWECEMMSTKWSFSWVVNWSFSDRVGNPSSTHLGLYVIQRFYEEENRIPFHNNFHSATLPNEGLPSNTFQILCDDENDLAVKMNQKQKRNFHKHIRAKEKSVDLKIFGRKETVRVHDAHERSSFGKLGMVLGYLLGALFLKPHSAFSFDWPINIECTISQYNRKNASIASNRSLEMKHKHNTRKYF